MNPGITGGLPSRIAASLGLGGLLVFLVIGGWLVAGYVADTVTVRRAVDHTREVLEVVGRVRTTVLRLRLETATLLGLPGEAGAEALEPLASEATQLTRRLEELLADDPAQRARATDLLAAMAEVTASARAVAALAAAGDVDLARSRYQEVRQGRGRVILDAIVAQQQRLLQERDETSKNRLEVLVRLLAIVMALALLSAGGAILALVGQLRVNARTLNELTAANDRNEAAHAALWASEGRLQSIMDHAKDAILLVGQDGLIELANAACRSVFHAEPASLVGYPLGRLLPADGPGTRAGGVIARRATGEAFPADISIGGFLGGENGAAVYVVRDASERHHLDRLKNEFVATVSHELRAPLASIRGALALLIGGSAGALPDKAHALLDIAHKHSRRLGRLAGDMLDVEKMASGRLAFAKEPVDAADLLRSAVQAQGEAVAELGVALDLAAVPAGSVRVLGDSERLLRALGNLVSNAARFSPRGSSVEIAAEADEENVVFTVRDYGPGIPETFKAKLFQPLAPPHDGAGRRSPASGLGLSIAKAVVEQHGGAIGFESPVADDAGTRFWVRLPRFYEEPGSRVPQPGNLPRLLIVEGDPGSARTLTRKVSGQGWAIETAGSAEAAQHRLAAEGIDAALIDLAGPDGLALLRSLRASERTRTLPVALVAARAGADGAFGWEALLVADLLEKPADIDRLRLSLDLALNGVSPKASETSGAAEHRPARLLLVEDEEELATVIRTMDDGRMEVIQARTLAGARVRLARERFDLLVLDPALPDGNGLSLLAERAGGHRATPVLLLQAEDGEVTPDLLGAALARGREAPDDVTHALAALRRWAMGRAMAG